MPDEMTAKLMKSIERQFSALPEHRQFGDSIECCDACGPENAFEQTRQPAEVWQPFLRRMAGARLLKLRGDLEFVSHKCESPIEELMFLALVLQGDCNSDDEVYFRGDEPEPFSVLSAVSINPQAVIGKYRVDFLVSAYSTKIDRSAEDGSESLHWHKASILVECDGHDFHEKTKEQASRDKQRDRDLQTAGFKIFRYTGSDVWNGCLNAAKEVVQAASELCGHSAPVSSMPRKPFLVR